MPITIAEQDQHPRSERRTMIQSRLNNYLFDAIRAGTTNLHLTVGLPPMLRVHGKVQPLDYPALTPTVKGP